MHKRLLREFNAVIREFEGLIRWMEQAEKRGVILSDKSEVEFMLDELKSGREKLIEIIQVGRN